MKKTVLVIEDNQIQSAMVKKLVLEVEPDATVYVANDIGTAYKVLMEKTIDVFLVDIILDNNKPGDTSGIRLIMKVREMPKYMFTPVVFISSLEDSSGYAYTDLNCLGYVEKPFSPERVKNLVKKALYYSTTKEKDATFCFRKEGILYPVKVKDIIYMESTNHYFSVHTIRGSILEIPYKTCKELLEEANTDCLIQCSRGTIVNKDYIENVDVANRYITLRDIEDKIEIGVTFKKKILAEFDL